MRDFNIGKNSVFEVCSQVRDNISENEIWYGIPGQIFKSK